MNILRSSLWVLVAAVTLLSILLAVSPAAATTTSLLAETESFRQIILRPRVSPDGQWAIYEALYDESISFALFSAPASGGPENLLTQVGGSSARFTADSTRVVFSVGLVGLYSVPVEGGVTVRLNDELGEGGRIGSTWGLTEDGQRAIFLAKQDAASPFELFSVSVLGGPVTKLNADLMPGGSVTRLVMTPGSSMLVYTATLGVDGALEIFTVDISSGVVTRLDTTIPVGRSIDQLEMSPDDTKILYVADQETEDVMELYAVALADPAKVGSRSTPAGWGQKILQGGAAVKLNDPLVNGGDVVGAAFSPDSSRVVYSADGDVDQKIELYSVSPQGGDVIKVSGSLVFGGNVLVGPGNLVFDPSSQRVIYRADQDVNNQAELYSAALGGGDVIKLNPPLHEEGDVDSGFVIDDGRVVFRADAEIEDVQLGLGSIFELYSVPAIGGEAIKLNPPLKFDIVNTDSVDEELFISSGEVFYKAPVDSFISEIYRVSITGGPSVKLNLPAAFIQDFLLSADGSGLFYTAPVVPGQTGVYRRPASAPGATVRLDSPSTIESGGIGQIEVSPSANRVVYEASQEVGTTELFSISLDDGSSSKLSDPMTAGGFVEFFYLSPDGSRVLYAASQDVARKIELYMTAVDGGDVIKLNTPVAEGGGSIFNFRFPYPFTPDGNTVVYSTYTGNVPEECANFLFSGFELFSVPSTGGTPTRLHPPLDPCVETSGFAISPASDRVAYAVYEVFTGIESIFSVPLDGQSPILLDTVSTPLSELGSLKISPDGSTLIYRARPVGEAATELYRVPMAGGDPVALIDSLPGTAFVRRNWDFSPDGSRVVYVADAVIDGQFALFSVPATGGPSIELSGTMVEGGDVDEAFAFSPSFGRVVFLADRITDGVDELFSVSLLGGEVSQLSAPLAAEADVAEFVITENVNGVYVVYRVQASDGSSTLFSVALGGGPAAQLSHGLAVGESLTSFEASQLGTHVIYRVENADEDTGVYYRVPISGGGAVQFSPPFLFARDELGADFPQVWVSPEGSRMIYGASREGDSGADLWLGEELDLFLDGFESGDTSRWSNTVPAMP